MRQRRVVVQNSSVSEEEKQKVQKKRPSKKVKRKQKTSTPTNKIPELRGKAPRKNKTRGEITKSEELEAAKARLKV